MKNLAFIDAQNLTQGTSNAAKPWKIDLRKFRVFLREKYGVRRAFYFFGAYDKAYEKMYKFVREVGYSLVFREHAKLAKGKKKGNVDTDIVFAVMDAVYRKKIDGKVVIVSGDGDYKKMVTRLITDKKLRAIMFPSPFRSSLYNEVAAEHKVRLYTTEVRRYLELSTKK